MKKIFISDVHLGAVGGPNYKIPTGKSDYDWLVDEEAKNLADFLNFLEAYPDLKEVVFLGDLMDNWVCPYDREPPTFDDIFAAPKNKPVFEAIAKLAGKTKVLYLPGNHDMGVTKDWVNANMPKVTFGGDTKFNSVYRSSRLLAEHGSAHAMFNAPDPINDPAQKLPLGFYISRLDATITYNSADPKKRNRHYWTYFDDVLECLGPQSVSSSVLEAIMEEAHLLPDDKIMLWKKPGRSEEQTINIQAVKDRFKNLYQQWEQTYGKGKAFKAMMAEIGWLEDMADSLCKKGDTNIVVFGHSHSWALDKDKWFVEDRIYANCGAWCDEEKPCTFVEVEEDLKAGFKNTVRVMQWTGKTSTVEKLKEDGID